MSNASNNQGRAYEFVCLNSLFKAISKIRPAKIVRNSFGEKKIRIQKEFASIVASSLHLNEKYKIVVR